MNIKELPPFYQEQAKSIPEADLEVWYRKTREFLIDQEIQSIDSWIPQIEQNIRQATEDLATTKDRRGMLVYQKLNLRFQELDREAKVTQ
jgi:hypothetical protein